MHSGLELYWAVIVKGVGTWVSIAKSKSIFTLDQPNVFNLQLTHCGESATGSDGLL